MSAIRSQVILALASVLLLGTTAQDDFLSYSPGIIRTYASTNLQVYLRWGTNTTLNYYYHMIYLYEGEYNSTNKYVVRCYMGTTSLGDYRYSGRVSCCSPSEPCFRLLRITEADAGDYSCRIQRNNQLVFVDSEATIYLYKSPSPALIHADHRVVSEGRDVRLTCTTVATSVPAEYRNAMTFTWRLNDTVVSALDRHAIDNDTLTITAASRGDRFNRYSCYAQEFTSTLASATSAAQRLEIICSPLGAFINNRPTGLIKDGDAVELTCSVQDAGNPSHVEYSWFKNGTLRASDTDTLSLTSVSADADDGTWECRADNSIPPASSVTFELTVNARPRLLKDLQNGTAVATDQPGLKCSFNGRPVATVEWLYNGGRTLPGSLASVSQLHTPEGSDPGSAITENTLEWRTTSATDDRIAASGLYKCVARNTVGSSESSQVYLQILKAEGGPSGSSAGMIAGVVVGLLAALVVAAVLVVLYRQGKLCAKPAPQIAQPTNAKVPAATRVLPRLPDTVVEGGDIYEEDAPEDTYEAVPDHQSYEQLKRAASRM